MAAMQAARTRARAHQHREASTAKNLSSAIAASEIATAREDSETWASSTNTRFPSCTTVNPNCMWW